MEKKYTDGDMMVDKTFAKKLGIKKNQLIVCLNVNEKILKFIRSQLPSSTKLKTELDEKDRQDIVITWFKEGDNFYKIFNVLQNTIKSNGAIWGVISKKQVAKKKGVNLFWGDMIKTALKTNLVDNKVLSFSEEDYGTRFVIRSSTRQLNSKFG